MDLIALERDVRPVAQSPLLAAAVLLPALAPALESYPPQESRREQGCLLEWTSRGRGDAGRCVACHGGPGAIKGGRHSGDGHLRGIRYAEALENADLHLRPADRLPRSIVLVNGGITCTTCHDGESRLPHKLASGPGGAVCLGCHDM